MFLGVCLFYSGKYDWICFFLRTFRVSSSQEHRWEMSLKIRTLQCSLAPSFPTLSLISINVFYQVPHKEVRAEQATLRCCSLQGGSCLGEMKHCSYRQC